MGVDDLMDLALLGVERTFGRTVSYRPLGGGSSIDVVGDFQMLPLGDTALGPFDQGQPRLDFREATLDAAGIAPLEEDAITVTVRGTARTYRVTRIERTDAGSVHLYLASRGAS